jgi:hypothetical protein
MKVSQLKQEMDARFAQVDARFVEVQDQITAARREFRGEIAREGELTRRHFDVVADQLKSDVSLLATAVATVQHTLERSLAENRASTPRS